MQHLMYKIKIKVWLHPQISSECEAPGINNSEQVPINSKAVLSIKVELKRSQAAKLVTRSNKHATPRKCG